ncbi:hypothetical protein DFH27DRAFT_306659 [Peziza echinospora]|nr:hypothetical protein DFH27DRAFT_306659 [Peziza echinospora]
MLQKSHTLILSLNLDPVAGLRHSRATRQTYAYNKRMTGYQLMNLSITSVSAKTLGMQHVYLFIVSTSVKEVVGNVASSTRSFS